MSDDTRATTELIGLTVFNAICVCSCAFYGCMGWAFAAPAFMEGDPSLGGDNVRPFVLIVVLQLPALASLVSLVLSWALANDDTARIFAYVPLGFFCLLCAFVCCAACTKGCIDGWNEDENEDKPGDVEECTPQQDSDTEDSY